MASSEAYTPTANEADAHGFLAINSLRSSQGVAGSVMSWRKSERIDAAHDPLPAGPNPATILTVPRPRASFAAEGQSPNLGIVLVDIGNYTTTASRVLGLGELEDIDYCNGAAAARSSQIRTRVVARKGEDGRWDLEFGPDTDVVCEKEGEVVVFDNMKLAMNPASEHCQLQQEKEKKIGIKAVYRRFIAWHFHTIFDASKTADHPVLQITPFFRSPCSPDHPVLHLCCRVVSDTPAYSARTVVLGVVRTLSVPKILAPICLHPIYRAIAFVETRQNHSICMMTQAGALQTGG
jgi:hypothetical protein